MNNTEGSAIRRIGHESWLRNIAVALGNVQGNVQPNEKCKEEDKTQTINALKSRRDHPSELVREHVNWALEQHEK